MKQDWFTIKKQEKVLTPEEIARKEAATWKEGFDEEKQMPFWSRVVVVKPQFDDEDIEIEDLPTKKEIVWEKPLELLTPEDRKKKLAEINEEKLQKDADEKLRIENEQIPEPLAKTKTKEHHLRSEGP